MKMIDMRVKELCMESVLDILDNGREWGNMEECDELEKEVNSVKDGIWIKMDEDDLDIWNSYLEELIEIYEGEIKKYKKNNENFGIVSDVLDRMYKYKKMMVDGYKIICK